MKKIKLSVVMVFTASILLNLFSCENNSANSVNIPEELTKWNATEILGEDYKRRDTIKIPEGVVRIEEEAFYECDAQTIIIPSTVTRIGDQDGLFAWMSKGVFAQSENLQSIEIPESVTYIGTHAFNSCKSLKTVTLNEGLTIIKNDAFTYCTALKEITIPQTVTSIGTSAFLGCSSLKKVILTENISVIDDSTFSDCTALTDITIPEGIVSIGYTAFLNCTNLTEITLPESLTKIETWAFEKCSSLESVTILAKNPPDIGDGGKPFSGNNNIKIYVPEDSVEAYKTQWKSYEDFIEAI